MSTSGKYGERQSWRRGQTDATGKRRLLKVALTALAIALSIVFIYFMLPGPKPKLVTILVSNDYDTDLVLPAMFGESARAALKPLCQQQLSGNRDFLHSNFHDTDLITQYLSDADDTVMVILRGYLMLNADQEPSLACSDLAIGPDPGSPQGLLPLKDLLEPLAATAPDSFSGVRLVVLDVEPLSVHPALGQSSDHAMTLLDATLKQLSGAHANRLWVLVTRGPLQNVSWDATTKLPLSTQNLIQGLEGQADFNQDGNVHLDELSLFLSERYQRLPDQLKSDTPRILLLRGGAGYVSAADLAAGDANVWINRPAIQPDDDAQPDAANPEQPEAVGEQVADKLAARQQPWVITPVAMQNTATGQTSAATGQTQTEPVSAAPTDAAATASDATNTPAEPSAPSTTEKPGGGVSNGGQAGNGGTGQTTANTAPTEITFWDRRDQFESVTFNDGQSSVIALAPHLWRRLVLQVLGAQIKDYDPASPSETPRRVAADLLELSKQIRGQQTSGKGSLEEIDDNIVNSLSGLLREHLAVRGSVRSDRRLLTADALQHLIAVARTRLWSRLEFERQAVFSGAQVPGESLLVATKAAEEMLAKGSGTEFPDQGSLDRQRASLERQIKAFDDNIESEVDRLLDGFDANDPPQKPLRTWELNRVAWAWLRSPLPNGTQRRKLESAIAAAIPDAGDTEPSIDATALVSFASSEPTDPQRSMIKNLTDDFDAYVQSTNPSAIVESSKWRDLLEQNAAATGSFPDQFSAALRIDPRIQTGTVNVSPIIHSITALPLVRNPSVNLLDDSGQALGDAAVLRLETMQDVRKVALQIKPDSERTTRLLVSYDLISSSANFSDIPVEVSWKAPGSSSLRAGEPLAITVEANEERELQLEIRPQGLAELSDDLVLKISIRGDRQSDEIKGVVGVYSLPIELPRANRLRLAASAFRGIGCSKEVLSDEVGLPGGLWLRTFNGRKTPFQFELFNQSGKACLAKIWLIKLPSPMPADVAAYWPDVAADRYSNPEGGVLDAEGRIQEHYLRPDRVLKGPSTISIPADQQRARLTFASPPATAGAAATSSSPSDPSDVDVSHGMALVCRLVDDQDLTMPEKDQLIYLVAKPWAADAYVNTKVVFVNNEVEVNAELNQLIDGDSIRDEIPELEKLPVHIGWFQDDQWADFQPFSTEPPAQRRIQLSPQTGKVRDFFSVPVVRSEVQTWVRLDVDNWPRAIRSLVQHQSGDVGQARSRNEIEFGSIALTRHPIGNQEQPSTTFYWPQNDVYFKGGGKNLVVTLRADGVFKQSSVPEVVLDVAGKPTSRYQTDRMIATTASLTDSGVITLLTQVSDIQLTLSQGQSSNDRIPIVARLKTDGEEHTNVSINATLDSSPPDSIVIRARKLGPYFPNQNIEFTISASDPGREGSGIARIDFGLDTKQDGKADTKREFHVFDPPVSTAVVPIGKSTFLFPSDGSYGVVVVATDAAGNETTEQQIVSVDKPKPMVNSDANGKGSAAGPKLGWLHGVIDTRAAIRGQILIDSPPQSMTTQTIQAIEPAQRHFSFGPLPEGKYTLRFKGTIGGSTRPLVWKDLEIDTTTGKTKPLSIPLESAAAE